MAPKQITHAKGFYASRASQSACVPTDEKLGLAMQVNYAMGEEVCPSRNEIFQRAAARGSFRDGEIVYLDTFHAGWRAYVPDNSRLLD